MRMPTIFAGMIIPMAALLGGCASPSKSGPTTSPTVAGTDCHAECLVCKYNADLACVDVKVGTETPHADYNGKTYFFCSSDCKTEFQKHPDKYAK